MINLNSKVCIYGVSGSGKSTLTSELIKSYESYLIIDYLYEYDGFGVITSEPYAAITHLEEDEYPEVTFRPRSDDDIDMLVSWVNHNKIKTQIIFEEYHAYTTPQKISQPIKSYIFTSRHLGGGYTAVTQRLGTGNKNFLSQANFIFSGTIILKSDKKTMEEESISIPPLEQYEFVYYDVVQRKRKILKSNFE